ncbi:Acetyltransferase (GNAT) domain-containing protein [Streptoalloteichus tenebrarius]|uniref:Acetyltransferase (GNAT) domain-containing protein n=1 Tax=Streptoalloteichus tenebrarius (strain ATCC 17920 / DSM 40477 / JCM 4838 / CBS 697.72 / NBRC 16177 / NCIMB 11028 / NRRL B-12390 / A12253. 1 / ISP 5477) TaxID=1933 RepID=A0ABT1I012_STRSD|nr:GNAT family N-acetyltransferase [Streptoalloteichus tenebrarius]MCP2261127.1 Acetyltransferase (GNAT) domain-containing protein [Streptoalloteichus tenebrarius]BFF03964.1 GNAT family N-acetyltransferase [Streptoalloteichus tenebrarius]
MTTGQDLLLAQAERFAGLDPLLPRVRAVPDGDVLTAALPDGGRVAGLLLRTENGPGTLPSLWSAREVHELVPLVGDTGSAGMEVLVRAWRHRFERVGLPGPDSACVVVWPSRDAPVTRVLLDHGLVPLSVLAVRTEPALTPQPGGGVRVRRASPADLDAVHELALAELRYSALVGGAVMRQDAAGLKRASLRARLLGGDPVWVAERDGVVVAMAECAWSEPDPTSWAVRLPPGRWGYVNCVSVLPGARGGGIGRRLMSVVHAEFARAGAVGTYLYYNCANPLSSVFWPRQGYRPLWTVWEVRPAGGLR